ncbi:MAG: hypothetical protein L3K02_05170, partial [Thermoplasmata archaeon]|nr:hypothetical protein [Thermoplasmata archaeon]
VSVDIEFTASHSVFAVTFQETGLPLSTQWSVTFHSVPNASTSDSIMFLDPNGTWSFTVGSVTGYSASITRGNVTVDGGPVTQDIAFSATPGPGQYTVSFGESGLPIGSSWGVTLHGALLTSSSASINFTETNGSLSFEVASVPGYTASPSTGSVLVNGAPVFRSITFATAPTSSRNNTTSPPEFLGLPLIDGYTLLGGIVLLVVLGVLVAIWYRRRGKPPAGTAPLAAPPGTSGGSPPP